MGNLLIAGEAPDRRSCRAPVDRTSRVHAAEASHGGRDHAQHQHQHTNTSCCCCCCLLCYTTTPTLEYTTLAAVHGDAPRGFEYLSLFRVSPYPALPPAPLNALSRGRRRAPRRRHRRPRPLYYYSRAEPSPGRARQPFPSSHPPPSPRSRRRRPFSVALLPFPFTPSRSVPSPIAAYLFASRVSRFPGQLLHACMCTTRRSVAATGDRWGATSGRTHTNGDVRMYV